VYHVTHAGDDATGPGDVTRLIEEVGYPSDVDIRAEFTRLLADIEAEMSEVLAERGGHARPLYDMLAYHLGLDGADGPRGKRMRPLLGLLAYESLTGDYRPALPGAAAVELGHNFSLVHDDIEDADIERRHRPTLWAIWGVPLAINAGDALFALSRLALYDLIDDGFSERRVLALMRVYDETCLALCEGQYLDISFERQDDVSVDAYLEMIGKKTAALVGASVQAGAILASDDDQVIEAYRRFGYDLGMAFQMADDVKGSFWSSQASGKPEAGDIRRRKKTLPLVWALEHAADADRARLRKIYAHSAPMADSVLVQADMPLGDEAVSEVLEILERSGAREHALGEARRYRGLALAQIDRLPCPPERRAQLSALVATAIAA
jgi:geranylgeranyl diphosphate synthase, type I